MIKLSKRLEVISSLIPNGVKIVDIGCDHGFLSIYLAQSKKVKNVIAADINENALGNAKANIKKYKLEEVIETRLGDGLDVIQDNDKIDSLVIAGMGEHTIIGMFKKNLEKLKKIKTMIIQSNTRIEFLRREVVKLGYIIKDEELVQDGKKIYTIICFEQGNKRYNKKEYYFGPILLKKKNELFKEYNKQELTKLYIIKKMIPKYKIIERYKVNQKIRLYKDVFGRL